MSERVQMVVLDDDPTGIQTVHGCLLLTRWEERLLREGFEHEERFFYVLTNTRAYEAERVRRIVRDVVRNTLELNREYRRPLIFVSRSDSTLRSHFPVEIDVIAAAVEEECGAPLDAIFVVPAFFEAGRLTAGDIHYVVDGERRIPVAQTEYARDRVFGYTASNLRSYIEEKTGGAVAAGAARSIPLAMLRSGETAPLREFLMALRGGYVVVNAERYADLERFAEEVLAAALDGKRFAFQSAASVVRALGGVGPKALIGPEVVRRCGPGLFLLGSHVQRTTDQLAHLLRCDGVTGLELSAKEALRRHESVRDGIVAQIAALWRQGVTPAVYTTREELRFESKQERLRAGQRISAVIADIVARLPEAPSYLVGKGGITSHDILVNGLAVEKAIVLGQILPGVPAITVPGEGRFGGMPYVIFPGNVGDEHALAEVYRKLGRRESSG